MVESGVQGSCAKQWWPMPSISATSRSRRSWRRSNRAGRPGRQAETRTVAPPEFDTTKLTSPALRAKDQRPPVRRAGHAARTEKSESYALVKQIKDELAAGTAGRRSRSAKKKLAQVLRSVREEIFRSRSPRTASGPIGAAFDEIRPISIETSVLPRTHGSALFTRGETQALVTATLGTTDDSSGWRATRASRSKRFMLHYNFPPFSVGEVGA